MQAVLSEVPRNPTDWEIWSRAHRLSHDMIRQAIRAQENGVDLPDYPLEPIEQDDFDGFLQRNSLMHIQFNQILQVNNSDLSAFDPRDETQLTAWIWLHFQEHRNVEQRLGISS